MRQYIALSKKLICMAILMVACTTKSQNHKDININKPAIEHKTSAPCESAKLDAQKTFETGRYVFTTYGLSLSPLRKTYGYKAIYDSILAHDYHIEYKKGGCTVSESDICYENELRRLVENKYGQNFNEDAKSKAVEVYSQTNEYQNKVLPTLQKDSIYRHIQPSEYLKRVERNTIISNHLYKYLEQESKNSKISFVYILNKDGSIDNISFSSPKDASAQNQILKALETLPPLKPALFFTEKVKIKLSYKN